MENQITNNSTPKAEGKNEKTEQSSLPTDGPVSKNEGQGTSPDLNDTKITNADDAYTVTNAAIEPEEANENDISQDFNIEQEMLDLEQNDEDWDTDVPEEEK